MTSRFSEIFFHSVERVRSIPLISTLILVVFLIAAISGCSSQDDFTRTATTKFFTQDYNPEYLDVLWTIDDRSGISRKDSMRAHLYSEAKAFFTRLDALTTSDYRMAFVSDDLELSAPGELKPRGAGDILVRNYGDADSRANYFYSIIGHVINLSTGPTNQGFESARQALKRTFIPRQNVPLVIVLISDSDDASPDYGYADSTDFYASEYLALKQNNADLLRVYSVNYTPTSGHCATETEASIDMPGFKDNYFKLARKLNGATADLCGSFSSAIDLSGLRQKVLPTHFRLDTVPQQNTLQVAVFDKTQTYNVTWKFSAATNEIIFDTAPPQGSTIKVTYFTN